MDGEQFREYLRLSVTLMEGEIKMLKFLSLVPDLPNGGDYAALLPYEYKVHARYGVEMIVNSRADAARIALSLFPPAPLSVAAVPPIFRPTDSMTDIERAETSPIFPVTFNSFLSPVNHPDGGAYLSKLIWFHAPSLEHPELRVICGAYVRNDPARLFEDSFYGFPPNGSIVTGSAPDSARTATVYWAYDLEPESWKQIITDVSGESQDAGETEWAELITENEQ